MFEQNQSINQHQPFRTFNRSTWIEKLCRTQNTHLLSASFSDVSYSLVMLYRSITVPQNFGCDAMNFVFCIGFTWKCHEARAVTNIVR